MISRPPARAVLFLVIAFAHLTSAATEPLSADKVQALQLELAKCEARLASGIKDADTFCEYGKCLYRLGRPSEALAAFESAIAAEPAHVSAHQWRAQVNMSGKNFSAALPDLNFLLEQSEPIPELWFARGLANGELGNFSNAVIDLEAFMKLCPLDYRGPLAKGRCETRIPGRRDDAEASFCKVILLSPSSSIGYRERAINRLHLGRPAEAVLDFDKAVEFGDKSADLYRKRSIVLHLSNRHAEAIRDAEQALSLNGKNAKDLTWLARCCLYAACDSKAQGVDTAIQYAEEALQYDPAHGEALSVLGSAKTKLGRVEEALKHFDAALASNPANTGILLERANAFMDVGRFAAAKLDVDRAIAIDSENAEAFAVRGRLQMEQKQYEAAVADLNTAINKMPGFLIAIENRGICHLTLRNWKAARDDFAKVLLIDSNRSRTYALRAQSYVQQGNGQLALPDLEKALSLDDENAIAYRWRGSFRMVTNDRDAVVDLARAAALSPEPADYVKLADCYCRLNELELAQKNAYHAVNCAPDLPDGHVILSVVCNAMGRYDDAKAAAEAALELDQDNVLALHQYSLALKNLGKN